MSISFLFFLFSFLLYSAAMPDALIKTKKEKIEAMTIATTTTTTTTKRKRSSKSRILNIYILINIALFICKQRKNTYYNNRNMRFDLTLHEVSQNFYHRVHNNRFYNFKIIIRICETHLHDVNIIK